MTINYLPIKKKNTQNIKKIIKKYKHKTILLPDNLNNKKFTHSLIHKTHKTLNKLNIITLITKKQITIPNITNLTNKQFQKTFTINIFTLF